MTMRLKYVVIDDESDAPTMDPKNEEFELFGLYKTAKKRAEECARRQAGTTFTIYEAIEDVCCAVGPPIGTKIAKRG